MNAKDPKPEKKQKYEAPKLLASYDKEELESLIRPEGFFLQSGGGCGCGGGS